jgi:hypothetical protein
MQTVAKFFHRLFRQLKARLGKPRRAHAERI